MHTNDGDSEPTDAEQDATQEDLKPTAAQAEKVQGGSPAIQVETRSNLSQQRHEMLKAVVNNLRA